ncbi:MAG: calcium/sodium antiporter [Candidatus Latescibacterota bacterium]|jgi:cation:H+ antiporter
MDTVFHPSSFLHALLLAALGLALLAGGGELLVRGAISTSRLLRVSPVVIGLTIVALATSLPELAVSLLAAFRGSPDVAVGNVVGSNLFNISFIVGISALLIPPLHFRSSKTPADVGVMVAAAIALIAMGWNGWFGRWEGVVFLTGLVVYLWWRVRTSRRDEDEGELATAAREVIEPHGKKPRGIMMSLLLILAGAGLLTAGAEWLVKGAIFIAREKGISERVIAVTLVSGGTGLPELATAVVAGIRRQSAVSIGNVIGSNIFNVLGILGMVSIVKPIPAAEKIIHQDALWMLGISLLILIPVLKPTRIASRVDGALLLAAYAAYLVWLFRF